MLLLWGVVLGVIIGFVGGGSVANLEELDLRHIWLVPVALIVQNLIFFPVLFEESVIPFLGPEFFHLLSYLILAVFVVMNWRVWQIPLMGAGMGLNMIVIASNGGYMPVALEPLVRTGNFRTAYYLTNNEIYGNVIMMSDSTILDFLGDWLYLPRWLPFSTAFSLGDLIIAIGLVYFFGLWMVQPEINT